MANELNATSSVVLENNALNYLAPNGISGMQLVNGSLNYTGSSEAVSVFDSLDFGSGLTIDNPGILLTSGDGTLPRYNGVSNYGPSHSLPGDTDLDEVVQTAFDSVNGGFITGTNDAAVLEFTLNRTNDTAKTLAVDIMFGSEEYPNYIDSFVDAGGVFINGVNYAFFKADPTLPLSVTSKNVESGSFIDNTNDTHSIEYNAISRTLTLFIPLADEQDTFDIKLAIADSGDYVLDSGLFVSDIRTTTNAIDGFYTSVKPLGTSDDVTSVGDDTATYFTSSAGLHSYTGSTQADVFDFTGGGFNTIKGTLEQINGDQVFNFTNSSQLAVQDNLTADMITAEQGSAIITIDKGDGNASTITFKGDYQKQSLVLTNDGQESVITLYQANGADIGQGMETLVNANFNPLVDKVIETRLQTALDAGASSMQIATVLAYYEEISQNEMFEGGLNPIFAIRDAVQTLMDNPVMPEGSEIIEIVGTSVGE